MTPERWQQIRQIFHAALEFEPAQRPAYLSGACNGIESLRGEVESLLASHEQSGTFIDGPAYEAAAELLVDVARETGDSAGLRGLSPAQAGSDLKNNAVLGLTPQALLLTPASQAKKRDA